MLDVMSSDYIRTARSKGLAGRTVVLRHALKNAMLPVVTIIGLDLAALMGSSIVTETVFQWPGMGLLFIQAVTFVDVPIMAAYLCIVALIFVALNAIVDMTYAVIDPRLKGADA